jgi:hypothetical protein
VTPREAVAELLGGPALMTGDDESDLWTAAARSWRNRERNSMLGGVVLATLNSHYSYPYRDIAAMLAEVLGRDVAEVPFQTLQRWAAPPPEVARGEGADR